MFMSCAAVAIARGALNQHGGEGPGGGERKVIAFDTFVLWVTGLDTAGPNHHTLA